MAVYVFVWRGNLTIQHKYKNCYFFRKSSGIMYLALAVALATWYNKIYITKKDSSGIKLFLYLICLSCRKEVKDRENEFYSMVYPSGKKGYG